MSEPRGVQDADAVVAGLRDDEPDNDLLEGIAIAFALGLGVARVVVGLAEVLFPKLFLRLFGRGSEASDGAAVGFRMKGGRDLGIGLATLAAATNGDRKAVADMTATGIVVDAVDGLAIRRDRGVALRRPMYPYGAVGGLAVAVAAGLSAAVLRRPR